MPTHKLTLTLNKGTSPNPSRQVSITHEGEQNKAVPLISPSTNQEIDIAFVLARLKSVYMKADGPVTIKTNSTSSPGNTFIFTATNYLEWNTESLHANPFAADVTKMYGTVAGGGSTVTIEIYVLTDSTP